MPNPYMDPPEEPKWPGEEEDDEEDIPVAYTSVTNDDWVETERPMPHVNWLCTAVKASNLAKKADEAHMMPNGSKPDQPTTDVRGTYMSGRCQECKATTIWKKVTL